MPLSGQLARPADGSGESNPLPEKLSPDQRSAPLDPANALTLRLKTRQAAFF